MKTEKVKCTPETYQEIIDEYEGNGWYLIEEQIHKDGMWLIFVDELPVDELTIEDRIADLEKRVEALEKK